MEYDYWKMIVSLRNALIALQKEFAKCLGSFFASVNQFVNEHQEPPVKAKRKIIGAYRFAYVNNTSRYGDKIALAYCDDKPCIISSIYTVFNVKDENKLLSRYLMMFFNRHEFDRYNRFNSRGGAWEAFDRDVFGIYRIPIASIEIQKSICLVYEAYLKRKKCFEELKTEINSICPILIKGSFEKDA